MTEYYGKIYVSARAIDEVNVQVIMERLGGGGHLTVAGAQLPGVTSEEAVSQLKEILSQLIEKHKYMLIIYHTLLTSCVF